MRADVNGAGTRVAEAVDRQRDLLERDIHDGSRSAWWRCASGLRSPREVSDDGPGFDIVDAPPGGGLQHVRDRIALLGGRVSIVSHAGVGTVVLADSVASRAIRTLRTALRASRSSS